MTNTVTAPRHAFSVAIFAKNPQGQVLLIHHRRLDTWLPVGGEIEAGETPLQAAQRELLEETGLTGTFRPLQSSTIDGTPAGLCAYEEHAAGSKGIHLNFCFVADVDGEPVSNGEWSAFRFVDSAQELPCPTNVKQLVDIARDGHVLHTVGYRWIDAFNARDLDRLLALYDDHAVHTSPKLREREPHTLGQVRGKVAMRAWWQDSFDRLPSLRYETQHVTAFGERVFVEYIRHLDGQPPMRIAELFVVRQGRIVESAVYHG